MANSSTNLNLIESGQSQKEVTANALFDAASPAMIFGRNSVTTYALSWGYYGGMFRKADGTFTPIANGTIALTASNTNYIEADPADGSVSKNTSGFSSGAIPLYEIVVGSSTVTSYTDYRCGTQGDGTLY